MTNPRNILEEAKYQSFVDLLNTKYQSEETVRELKEVFARDHIVHLPEMFSEPVFSALKEEALKLTEVATSKNFTMSVWETPRILHVVNAPNIIEHSKLLWTIYNNHFLVNFMQEIVGAKVYPSRQPVSFLNVNHLKGTGSTHGWHVDDGAFAFILSCVSPDIGDGGTVEYVPHWPTFCKTLGRKVDESVNDSVEKARMQGLVRELYLAEGDGYIIRSDTTLHRVTELKSDKSERVAYVGSYENTPTPVYQHTGNELYA